MKKNVLFVVTSFGTGGINRALQNFLNRFDKTVLDVDVFVMAHEGVYEGEMQNCHVMPCNRFIDALVGRLDSHKGLMKTVCYAIKSLDRVSKHRFKKNLFRRVGNNLVQSKHYDAVIAFSENLPTLFVGSIDHPNKIAWIHCDYASYFELIHHKSERSLYETMKTIVCVSDFTRSSFLNIYPKLADKTCFIYNVLDDEMMKRNAKMPIEEEFDISTFNLVSIGRFDSVKRLSIIPELAKKILDNGCKIKWYVIGPNKGGEGDNEYFRFYENIIKFNVEEIVVSLGEKTNPYPYIANADLLVNTSVSEACPYVINEAKILQTPVVCTDFGSAKEFVSYGTIGYYEPIDQLADRIVWLINNRNQLQRFKMNLASFQYDNGRILEQIYELTRS